MAVDFQVLFNWAVGVIGMGVLFIMNRTAGKLDKIDSHISDIPVKYVAKEDYRNDVKEIKDMLGKIFDRMETKADKYK